jgi:hypothetical protein
MLSMSAQANRSRVRRAGAACLGLLALSALWVQSARAAELYSEDSVKAAYLYRFAGYVTWPEALPAGTPFVIDVVGAPGVAQALRGVLHDHLINGHVAQVREVKATDWGPAQMIYIGPGRADSVRALQPAPPGRLIVTDEEDGLSAGSTINLVTLDRNVRFEVSVAAGARWGLKISSELLGVALRVQDGKHP